MRRAVAKVVAVVVLGLLPFAAVAEEKELTPEQKTEIMKSIDRGAEAGKNLLILQHKGIVKLVLAQPSPILFVDHLFWKLMDPQKRTNLGTMAIDFIKAVGIQKGQKYTSVYLNDMKTRDNLAIAYINEHRVEFTK